ncbi:MAG: 2-oxoglutarate oxidoreductase, partial [bacterium]|nr:2-oxoglutarate oxidoreductase [bacterium]
DGLGFSMIEALCVCPVQWGMDPKLALQHVDENVVKVFPPGEYIDRVGKK